MCQSKERTELCCEYCDCVNRECGWSIGGTREGERRCTWSKTGYLCVVVKVKGQKVDTSDVRETVGESEVKLQNRYII